MKWFFMHKKLFIVLGIFICIMVPIFTNILLSFDLVPSKNTDSTSWLGFWGSFFGGIIGGLATLVGVELTIYKMDEEKKNNCIYIVPLELNQMLLKTSENSVETLKDLDLVNVGKEHALNVSIEYDICKYKEVESYGSDWGITLIEKDLFNTILELSKESTDKIQVLPVSEGDKIYNMKVPMLLQVLINFIVVNLLDNYFDDLKVYRDIPLGKIKFIANNNYGKSVKIIYQIYMKCFFSKSSKEEKYCALNLNFKLDNLEYV